MWDNNDQLCRVFFETAYILYLNIKSIFLTVPHNIYTCILKGTADLFSKITSENSSVYEGT